jgi:hypothetical protein
MLELSVGTVLTADFVEERHARKTAEIFNSTVESFTVLADQTKLPPLFKSYDVQIRYPERVVISIRAEEKFADLTTCGAALKKGLSLVKAKYGVEPVGSELGGVVATKDDLSIEYVCLLRQESRDHFLHLAVRSISETERWMAKMRKNP